MPTEPAADLADHTAEQAIIGAALTQPALITTLDLHPDHFHHPPHTTIWTTLLTMHKNGDKIDAILAATKLAETGQLAKIGGGPYLHTCIAAVPTIANAPDYANKIKQLWVGRALQTASARLHHIAGLTDPTQRHQLAGDELAAATALLTSQSPNGHHEPQRLDLTALAANGVRAPMWTWHQRIPANALTLLAGREGIGKSSGACWLAARLTRGELPGRHQGTPTGVVMIATEDAWPEVIAPRMIAAGADLNLIYRLNKTNDDPISIPTDLHELTQLCLTHHIGLLIIDPLMSVIHSSLDTHKDREVRQALDPLATFAQTTNIAILGLIHTNKSPTTDPLNSLMGSRAFSAAARSVLYCVTDPTAEHEDRYLLGHPKSNLGPKQPTLNYHLIETKIEAPDADTTQPITITTSRLIFDGQDDRSIRDVLEASHTRTERPLSENVAAILDWITDQGRTIATAEVEAAFPSLKSAAIRKILSRMVERGQLSRPLHGHYAVPRNVTRDSDSLSGDFTTDTTDMSVTPVTSRDHGRGCDNVTEASDVSVVKEPGHPSQTSSQTENDPWNRPKCIQNCGTVLQADDDPTKPCRFCQATQQ